MLLPGYDPYQQSDGYYFDAEAAEAAVAWIQRFCRHVKGIWAGKQIKLEPWQRGFVGNLVGWKSERTGLRRYRQALLFIPRKNGKSFLVAALQLYFLFCDGEFGAENYSIAYSEKQANLVWGVARRMIDIEPELKRRARLYARSIVIESINSFYQAFPGSPEGKHGLNPHIVNADEIHEMKYQTIFDAFETAFGSRTQPLFLFSTTSDIDRPSPCNRIVDTFRLVRDNALNDPTKLPALYEANRDDNWTSEDTWRKANPNLGVSISMEFMRGECAKAKLDRHYENEFKRLHLNIRSEQSIRYIKMHEWDACSPSDPIDMGALTGRTCFGGLDLASIEDLAAFVLCFPPEHSEDSFILLPFFWVPAENAEIRSRKKGVDYLTWAKSGHLNLSEGNRIDYDLIETTILGLAKQYHIMEIAYDPWNAEATVQSLMSNGMNMRSFQQSARMMTNPIKQFNRLIGLGRINHGGHPVLRWNAGNFAVRLGTGAGLQPDKKHLGEKFDGIVASVMALDLALLVQGQGSLELIIMGG